MAEALGLSAFAHKKRRRSTLRSISSIYLLVILVLLFCSSYVRGQGDAATSNSTSGAIISTGSSTNQGAEENSTAGEQAASSGDSVESTSNPSNSATPTDASFTSANDSNTSITESSPAAAEASNSTSTSTSMSSATKDDGASILQQEVPPPPSSTANQPVSGITDLVDPQGPQPVDGAGIVETPPITTPVPKPSTGGGGGGGGGLSPKDPPPPPIASSPSSSSSSSGPAGSRKFPTFNKGKQSPPLGPQSASSGDDDDFSSSEFQTGYDTNTETQRLKQLETGHTSPVVNAIGFTIVGLAIIAMVWKLSRRVIPDATTSSNLASLANNNSNAARGTGEQRSAAAISGGGGVEGRGEEDEEGVSTANPLRFHHLHELQSHPSSNGARSATINQYRASLCSSCRKNPRTHALVPCSHLVCESCAQKASFCPTCKSSVVARNWVISP